MRVFAALFLLSVMAAAPVGATEHSSAMLRLLVADSLPPPYLTRAAEGVEPEGLAIAMCRKVAARLGYGTVVRVAPPKRVPELMRAGEADMLCHVAPEWYAYPDDLWFGRRLYSADNVFIARKDAKPVCDACPVPAEVATVIGYEYGARVGQAFAGGASTRRDVRSEENVFRLVQHGRIDYGIVSEYTFHYFAGDRSDLSIKGYAARYHITVAVPRNGPISEAELMAASAAIRLPDDVAPEYRAFLGLPKQK